MLGLEERGASQEKRRCQASLVTDVHYIHYHFTSALLLLIKSYGNYLCKSCICLFFKLWRHTGDVVSGVHICSIRASVKLTVVFSCFLGLLDQSLAQGLYQ